MLIKMSVHYLRDEVIFTNVRKKNSKKWRHRVRHWHLFNCIIYANLFWFRILFLRCTKSLCCVFCVCLFCFYIHLFSKCCCFCCCTFLWKINKSYSVNIRRDSSTAIHDHADAARSGCMPRYTGCSKKVAA